MGALTITFNYTLVLESIYNVDKYDIPLPEGG